MFRFLLSFQFVLFLSTSIIHAQNSLSGTITDSTSRSGVSFANVALYNEDSLMQATLSDSAGIFTLGNVLPGRYSVQASAVGYVTKSKEILFEASNGSLQLGDIVLEQDAKLLNAVEIHGEKAAVQYHADRTVLNIAGNSVFKASVNAMDILRKAPGVSVDPDGALLLSGRNPPVIFINGRPRDMSPEETLAYLSSLSPDAIESIEIIANPSSRYDGQFKGIIDVRLKADLSAGIKGSFNSAFRQNIYTSVDNSLNLSYRAKNVTYNLRAAYVFGDDFYQYDALQRLANKTYMTTNTESRTNNNNPTLQLGADYTITKNQHFEFLIKAYQANRHMRTNNSLTFEDSLKDHRTGLNLTETLSSPDQQNYAANAGYDFSFQNGKLSLFGTLTKITNKQKEDIQVNDALRGTLRSYWKTGLQNEIMIRTVQADFSKSLKTGRIESGLKYTFITTDNNLRYDTLDRDNAFVPDAGRSNQFLYDEHITAGYLLYDLKLRQLTFNFNLRAEHTRSIANAITESKVQARNYLSWLPGANISYEISKSSRLSFALTRRITRPTFDQLNPFRFYLSPLNYRVGNPYLRPSLTTAAQVTYNYSDFNITANIGREKDMMNRYPEYNRVTNELLYLGINLPYSNFASLESGYTFNLFSWWKTTHNVGGYYHKHAMPYLGKTYAIGIFDYAINGSQIFTLSKGVTADLTYRYKSGSGSSLYIAKPLGSVDMGLQRSWLQGKLSTKLNFYDIFYTYRLSFIFREKAIIDNQFTHQFRTRRAVLAISYNFGSGNYNAKKARTNDEESRAGN